MCSDCDTLHRKLKEQSHEMWTLRKTITKLRNELKYERKVKQQLIREKKKHQKQRYRNGKRGTQFNG